MRPRFWETTSFKKLEADYNSLLKKNGFKDIEKVVNGERVLSQRSDKAHWQPKTLKALGKIKYYEDLSNKAHNSHFANDVDQVILILRSEGCSYRTIIFELSKIGIKKHRETIQFIIRRYEHLWGLRDWSLEKRGIKKHGRRGATKFF